MARTDPGNSGKIRELCSRPVHALPFLPDVEASALGRPWRAANGSTIEAMAFRAAGKNLGEALTRLRGSPVHLAGTLAVNRYGGRERRS
jgi:single-stranded-DNA-specific exonuclease